MITPVMILEISHNNQTISHLLEHQYSAVSVECSIKWMFLDIPGLRERKGLYCPGGARDQLGEKCVAVIKPSICGSN